MMEKANWIRMGLFAGGMILGGAVLVVSCEESKETGRETADTWAPAGDTSTGGCIDDTQDSIAPVDTGPTPDTGHGPVDTSDSCPEGMMPVAGAFCVDVYEASRPDATATSSGTDNSYATTRYGVLPWSPGDVDEAVSACEAAGKRLCTAEEWVTACRGPDETTYAYGDAYDAEICNGIDAHCNCEDSSETCQCDDGVGYAGCYYDCEGSSYSRATTGAYPDCTNEYRLFDLNGNVWEYTLVGEGEGELHGGAYNCGDSAAYHACDFVATWSPSACGFRCCHDGEF